MFFKRTKQIRSLKKFIFFKLKKGKPEGIPLKHNFIAMNKRKRINQSLIISTACSLSIKPFFNK